MRALLTFWSDVQSVSIDASLDTRFLQSQGERRARELQRAAKISSSAARV
jgi:hypothetical protein